MPWFHQKYMTWWVFCPGTRWPKHKFLGRCTVQGSHTRSLLSEKKMWSPLSYFFQYFRYEISLSIQKVGDTTNSWYFLRLSTISKTLLICQIVSWETLSRLLFKVSLCIVHSSGLWWESLEHCSSSTLNKTFLWLPSSRCARYVRLGADSGFAECELARLPKLKRVFIWKTFSFAISLWCSLKLAS